MYFFHLLSTFHPKLTKKLEFFQLIESERARPPRLLDLIVNLRGWLSLQSINDATQHPSLPQFSYSAALLSSFHLTN